MAYTKQSLNILGVGLSCGLIVGGIASISTGTLPLFLALFGSGILILVALGVWNRRAR